MAMLEIIKYNPFFWIALTIGGFLIGKTLNQKFQTLVFNELLFAVILVILVMKVTNTDYHSYMEGGQYIGFILTPATAALGVKLYKNITIIKKNAIPIISGILMGILTSLTSMLVLSKVFKLVATEYATLLPKSVTAAIANGISDSLGGNVAITTATVILTGIIVGIFGNFLIKKFKISDPISIGIALGASGHGQGTVLAMRHSETAGAVASMTMCLSAIITVIVAPIWFSFTVNFL